MPGGALYTENNGRVVSQLTKTTNTTLSNIPGLVFQLPSEQIASISFKCLMFVNADAVGGYKFAMSLSGGPTAAAGSVQILAMTLHGAGILDYTIWNSIGTTLANAGETALTAHFEGSFLFDPVNRGSTAVLAFQFAQSVANGSSTVLAGSFCNINSFGQ